MAKRFTDTDLWKTQRWFRKLSPNYKLSFCYIKDQCNHAGIWKIDCSDLIEDLGFELFDLNDFILNANTDYDKVTGIKSFKNRLVIVNNSFLWITGFIQFQYESKENKVSISAPVKTALLALSGIGTLTQALHKGYITLTEPLHEKYITLNDNLITLIEDLREGYITPKDKDKDKAKNKTINKGVDFFENKKGTKFSEDFTHVIFDDGTKQELGSEQFILAQSLDIIPQSIIKGYKY